MKAIRNSALLIGLATASVASASVIQFDPDGPGPAASVQVSSFDWLPGDAMLQVTPDFTKGTLYFQAKLGALLDANNHVIPCPGLNAPSNQPGYEITVAFGVPVTVTPSATTIVVNGLDTTSAFPSYMSIYFDQSRNSDNLAGTGFRDGTRIYSSNINQALAGIFGSNANISALDLFDSANYSSIVTPIVSGGGTVAGATASLDPAFFLDGLNVVGSQLTNGTLVAPFSDVDPSALFEVGQDGNISPLPFVANSRNGDSLMIQLESDAATSFTTAVPEPGTLIAGLPLLGLILRRRRS